MGRQGVVGLLGCLLVILLSFGCASQAKGLSRPLVIDDFESDESLWHWGRWMSDAPAPMVLSGEPVSQGEHSLKVTFPEAESFGIHTFSLPRDWSAYDSLRFDIYYDAPTGDPSNWLGFNVYIDDFHTTGWETNFHEENWRLRPGWNYEQIDIDSIAGRRDAINPASVKALYFILSDVPANTVLYFDNIRLVPRKLASSAGGVPRLEVQAPSESNRTDRLTVTSPGRFELEFDPNVGTVTRWFDLTRDPGRRMNLVAEYGRLLNDKFGFKDEGGSPAEGSWYLAPTEVPILLEASPVRARVRMLCPGARSYGGGPLRANVQGTTDYTIYPTGRVFVRNELRVGGEPYRSHHFQFNLKTSWAAYHGSGGEAIRSAAQDFILHTHRGPEVTADALLVWHTGERPTSYFNAPYERMFYRSGVQLAEAMDKVLAPGTSLSWCFLLQLKPDDLDSEDAARPYALDYRNPAKVTVSQGALVTDDPGDADGDGFNEAEGCTVLAADREGKVAFVFDPGEVTHYWPVFKVRQWRGAGAVIRTGGQPLHYGEDFIEWPRDAVLLVQLLQPVTERTEFAFVPFDVR
jgi:hypothetical protein